MNTFQDNYVFLQVGGYEISPQDIIYFSSAPLFTYNKFNHCLKDWGLEQCHFPNASFWLTEFCIIYGSNLITIHEIPGAYLKINRNSISCRNFDSAWRNGHDRYIFKNTEIWPQKNVKKVLESIIIKNESIVFYNGSGGIGGGGGGAGGLYEKLIGELCQAKEVVNIKKDLGFDKSILNLTHSRSNKECKVHARYFQLCPLQQACFFMEHIEDWLPKYLNKGTKKMDHSSNNNNILTLYDDDEEDGELIDL